MLKTCSHVCVLRSYPCKWIRYSKHTQETHKSKISLISNSSWPSILTCGNDQICFSRMVDSWKGSRIETWNIKWIFINLQSYNQNELHLLFYNPQNWICPWRPSRNYIWRMFYKWKCNCFFSVFSRRCWSLWLFVKIIKWFIPRTTIILCCKTYVIYL